MAKTFLVFGAINGFLAVAFGAFGAHALKSRLSEYALGVYKTGVEYHFYHAFALVIVGIVFFHGESASLKTAGWSFLVGIVLFSGSLYALSLSGVKILGAITPFGGLSFLLGWALLAIHACKSGS